MRETQKAYLAAGCFWGVEEAFRILPGVKGTRVGYAGGKAENPTYEQVSSNTTGHAETVEIEFDPHEISFERILKEFWEVHDPTTLDQQGPDIGSQYRSVIFYVNEKQKETALASKKEQEESKRFERPIVTQITALKPEEFYPAEEYHQKYLAKRGAKVC